MNKDKSKLKEEYDLNDIYLINKNDKENEILRYVRWRNWKGAEAVNGFNIRWGDQKAASNQFV